MRPITADEVYLRSGTRKPDSLKRLAVVLVLLLGFGAVAPGASAQTDEEIEWAVQARLASRSLLLDADSAGGRLVVVGERGHILVSSDHGDSWTQVEVPTRATLTGVFFHDEKLGWAVGHDAVILRTTDGGTTWERVHWAPEEESPFLDVWFADARQGYAVGAYGNFYITRDGGKSWDFEPIGEYDYHLNAIESAGDDVLYMAVEAGQAYRSDDQGTTWTSLALPYVGSFFGVLPLDDESVLMFGLRGHLYRSEDSGQTWELIETGTVAMLNSGVQLEDGTIIVAGLGGVVLISKDGGVSFELHPQEDRSGIQKVLDVGEGRLLLVGEGGIRVSSLEELTAGEGGNQ